MVASRKTASYWLAHAVIEEHAKIIPKHRVSHSRIDAYTRRHTGKDQIFGADLLQRRIEFSLVEAAESCFVDDDVFSLRLKLGNDIGIPSVSDEKTTCAAIRCLGGLANAELQMSSAIDRVLGSQVGQVRLETHLEVDNWNAGLSRCREAGL